MMYSFARIVPRGTVFNYSRSFSVGKHVKKVPTLKDQFRIKKYSDGSVYEGSWEKGEWSGPGKLTSAANHVWEGEFRLGKVHNGKGVLALSDGAVYEGTWREGKMDGQGKVTESNGSYLKGEFRADNLFNGVGLLVHPNGSASEATWEEGKLHGDGVKVKHLDEQSDNDSSQKTTVRNNLKKGPEVSKRKATTASVRNGENKGISVKAVVKVEGKLIDKNGDVYVGELHNGKPHGFGVKTCVASGAVYEGMWELGKKCGNGKLETATRTIVGEFRDDEFYDVKVEYNGALEEGTWVSGQGEGESELLNADGSVLKGEFLGGRIYNGSGVMKFVSGIVLEGIWVEGYMEGQGKVSLVNGITYSGEFRKTVKHGLGTFNNPDGGRYEGYFYNNKFHGQGKYIYTDGSVYEGEWRNGKEHGQGRKTCEKGVVDGEFRCGRLYNGTGVLVSRKGWTYVGEWKEKKFYGDITDEDGIVHHIDGVSAYSHKILEAR